MSPPPESFIEHLKEHGYHPRSDKHSNALAEAIALDLFTSCEAIYERAIAGNLVYDLNFTIRAGTSDWNIDLVIGQPPSRVEAVNTEIFQRTPPATVQIAVELKSIMTEHRKAIKNRKRDMEAHHEHVHNYGKSAVAGGVFVINAAPKFRSPLRPEVTVHNNPEKLVTHCIEQLRAVTTVTGQSQYGLDAKCALVVEMDNGDSAPEYVATRLAPQIGDPMHYDSFIQTICNEYKRRF